MAADREEHDERPGRVAAEPSPATVVNAREWGIPGRVGAGVLVVLLAGVFTMVLAGMVGAFRSGGTAPNGSCTAPELHGTVVHVTLTDGGQGVGERAEGPMGGVMGPGSMWILLDRDEVPAGTVSFEVANTGTLVHEMVVLPLAAGSSAGDRRVGADDRVSEAGALGEASKTCGYGAGSGITPGGLGWVTLKLRPGAYELICNYPGHYEAGMYARLVAVPG